MLRYIKPNDVSQMYRQHGLQLRQKSINFFNFHLKGEVQIRAQN